MEIVLIVAVADNGVIGAGGAIPWRLKSDQHRLKAITMGKPVVMGRKTFISLRRPLSGRTNIVVTAPGARKLVSRVMTILVRPGNGRRSEMKVLRPITTGLPIVIALRRC